MSQIAKFHSSSPTPFGLVVLAALFFVYSASAGLDKIVDQRETGSESRKFILFCAKSGTPSHAFVMLGDGPEPGEIGPVIIQEASGFYPVEERRTEAAFLKTVPGKVKSDYLQGTLAKSQCRLVVKVEEEGFVRIQNFLREFGATQKYHLTENSCVDMVATVARQLELEVPETEGTANLPANFLHKLAQSNGKNTADAAEWRLP